MKEQFDAESYLKSGSNELRILEYRCGEMSFGINILKVNKIVTTMTHFTAIPESHPAVKGIFRDMQRLVPVIDLAAFLGTGTDGTAHRKVIVTEFLETITGFLVGEIKWIHHFNWKDVVDAHDVFNEIDQKYVIGIVKAPDGRMILLLDYETILMELYPPLSALGASTAHLEGIDFTGRKILIAEDSAAIRSILQNELAKLGAEVVPASDGADGWREFQKQPFDLVISDVEMPQMDGLALTSHIRQSERASTPVIIYSSIGDTGMKARARFLNADAHITKLNFNELLTVADKLMRGEKCQWKTENYTP